MSRNGGSVVRPVLRRVGALFGVDLRTDLTLSGDLSLREPSRERVVTLTAGPVSTTGVEVWRSTTLPDVVCRRDDAGLTLRWADAAFGIGGDRIVVEAIDAAWAFERYLNPVMSLVVALGGGTCLHGFAAQTPEGTVAIMGHSGYGKTSLGLALLERGSRLVTDDLLAFDAGGAVRPGPRFVRLDTDDISSHDPAGKTRLVVPGVDGPVGVDLIIVFTRDDSGFTRVERQMHAVDLLLGQMYSPIAPNPAARQANLTQAVSLAANASVYECQRFHQPVEQLADRTMDLLTTS